MLKAYLNYTFDGLGEKPTTKEVLVAISSDKEKLYTFINIFIQKNSLSRGDNYIRIEDDSGQIIEKIELCRLITKI